MAKQKIYTWKSTEEFIDRMANEHGYEAIQLNDGSLGIGDWVLVAPDEKHYNFVIREVYYSPVCSGQTIRKYRKLSKKILKEIEDSISDDEEDKIPCENSIGVCFRCGSPLYPSSIPGYTSQCLKCDEDFYGFEQNTTD